jgi:hypothetical protein
MAPVADWEAAASSVAARTSFHIISNRFLYGQTFGLEDL